MSGLGAAPAMTRDLDRSLLPASLIRLSLLRYKAALRRMVFGSAKRRVFTIVGLCLMALYLLPQLLRGDARIKPETVRLVVPVALLGIAVLQLITRAKRHQIFQAAELDLVVPGPFARRQLVLYQVAHQVGPLLLVGAWIAIFLRTGGTYVPRALGVALLFQFVNMTAALLSIGAGVVVTRSRWGLVLAVLGVTALAAVVISGAPPFPAGGDAPAWIEWVKSLRHTPVVDFLCLPAAPFAELLLAPTIVGALPWAVAAVLLNSAMIGAFVALDRSEVEALVTRSQRQLDRLRRARVGGAAGLIGGEKSARRSVAALPRWGGAGTLLWRQLTVAYRGSGPVVGVVAGSCLAAGSWFGGRFLPPESLLPTLALAGVLASYLCSIGLRFDFRSDIDHMATLKSLPIGSIALTAGQVAGPIVVGSCVQSVLFVGLSAGNGSVRALAWCPLFIGAAILLNGAMVLVENVVFLLAPTRSWQSSMQAGFDPSQVGRQMLVLLLKMGVFAVAALVIGGPVTVLVAIGAPAPVVLAVGALAGVGCTIALLNLCSYAFRRFDIAEDQPA